MSVIAKIPTGTPALDRFQEQVVRELNPIIRAFAARPVVTGSRGGNAALASLISALATLGLITDQTTP